MKRCFSFKECYYKTVLVVSAVFALVTAKSLWTVLSWKWPTSQEKAVQNNFVWPSENYRVSSLLVLSSPQRVLKTAGFDAFTLKASFASGAMRFIMFKDGEKLVLLNEGDSYNGLKLEKVYPEKAVFVNGVTRHELLFKKQNGQPQQQSPSLPPSVKMSRAEFQAYQKDPTLLQKDVSASDKGGSVIIKSIKEGTFFAKAGIISGDTIASFNGANVQSVPDLVAKLLSASNDRNINISIIRDNVKKELSYELQ